jgi:hypothetical protein
MNQPSRPLLVGPLHATKGAAIPTMEIVLVPVARTRVSRLEAPLSVATPTPYMDSIPRLIFATTETTRGATGLATDMKMLITISKARVRFSHREMLDWFNLRNGVAPRLQ